MSDVDIIHIACDLKRILKRSIHIYKHVYPPCNVDRLFHPQTEMYLGLMSITRHELGHIRHVEI